MKKRIYTWGSAVIAGYCRYSFRWIIRKIPNQNTENPIFRMSTPHTRRNPFTKMWTCSMHRTDNAVRKPGDCPMWYGN